MQFGSHWTRPTCIFSCVSSSNSLSASASECSLSCRGTGEPGQAAFSSQPCWELPSSGFTEVGCSCWSTKTIQHGFNGTVTAPSQHLDVFTIFSVSWHKLESLPGTAAVEGMTPPLFIHSVGTITVCLYRIREHLQLRWVSVWISQVFLTLGVGIPLSASCSRTRWRSSRWGSVWGWIWQTEAWAKFLFLLERAKWHTLNYKRH